MLQRILLPAGLTAALLVGQVGSALAATLYDAQASSILTITGFFDAAGTAIEKPSDLLVEGDARVFDRFDSALGSASADTLVSAEVLGADPLDLGVGEGVALEARAFGNTSFPPVSSAESVARTDGLIFFDNLSATATYQVGYELDVSWMVDSAADLPASEAAAAEIRILLESSKMSRRVPPERLASRIRTSAAAASLAGRSAALSTSQLTFSSKPTW